MIAAHVSLRATGFDKKNLKSMAFKISLDPFNRILAQIPTHVRFYIYMYLKVPIAAN